MLLTLKRNGGHPVLDFVNTIDPRCATPAIDHLQSYGDLANWSRLEGVIDANRERALLELAAAKPAQAKSALRRAISLRELAFRIFSALVARKRPELADVRKLGSLAAAARGCQVLEQQRDGYRWGWNDAPSLDLPAAWLANSASQLLTEYASVGSRVRLCDGDRCGWLFLDTSKGGQRRWCSMESCGNRAKARRSARRR